MNGLFALLEIESWKPVISALLLPPAPLVLMTLVGAGLMRHYRRAAWLLLLGAALGTWLMCTAAAGAALTHGLLRPPPSLSPTQADGLRGMPKAVIVVFGGGTNPRAPEYGTPTLNSFSVERLRYGIWLSRRTSLPLAFSGGLAHGLSSGPTEAELAAHIAEREFGHPLRWTETRSRDTAENAVMTLQLMKDQGIEHIVLVTHGYHMPRALAAFDRALERTSTPMKITPAPLGIAASYRLRVGDWLPSRHGFDTVNRALHEWLGRLGGA